MKIWFDKKDINYNNFLSEQFLFLPLFTKEVINRNKDFIDSELWQKYISESVKYVDDLSECDVVVYPNKLDTDIKNYIDVSIASSKKLLCFYNDDNQIPTRLPDCVEIYRTSLTGATRKQNEYGLPAWSCDFANLADITYRKKQALPVVGFCGALTHTSRYNAIEALKTNNNIISNIKLRDSFWGGNIHNRSLRDEFIQNMIQSDFILCCRGAGNFSYRLYECLSLGKIPIIINTDIVLPCNDILEWQNIGIWINNITDINEAINTLWSALTDNDYIEKQLECRRIYDEYISPIGFTKYLNNKYTIL